MSRPSITPADVSDMLNTPGYKRYGNFCSARDYFLKMSNGKLDYKNVVIGPITLSHEKQYYVEHPLVEETLQAVTRTGINLMQFDSKKEGYIDAINILYAGKSLYHGRLHMATQRHHKHDVGRYESLLLYADRPRRRQD